MKLTAREKRALLKAAEMIELDEEVYSCIAIRRANGSPDVSACPLARRYSEFYERCEESFWPDLGEFYAKRQHLRVMLILMFLEVNK